MRIEAFDPRLNDSYASSSDRPQLLRSQIGFDFTQKKVVQMLIPKRSTKSSTYCISRILSVDPKVNV